jgi:hypothetical protein
MEAKAKAIGMIMEITLFRNDIFLLIENAERKPMGD